jgi:two-component system, LuxR family, response regulator FixJ
MRAMPEDALIAVVDDDNDLRRSTGDLLRAEGYRVDSFTNGAEFIASDPSAALSGILLDIEMPGLDGIGVLKALQERGLKVPVIVVTGQGDVPTAVQAMRLGAVNFLEKPYVGSDLLRALRDALDGPAPRQMLPPDGGQARAKVASLTERQRGVLIGVMKGQANKVIAYELGLSVRTVESYRAQMLEKLGVRGTAEAVRIAIAGGLAEEV